MVKTLEFRGVIPFASPEMVFKLLFEDDAFTRVYHKEMSKDENPSVTPWTDVDGHRQRKITFKPQLPNLPGFLKYIIGGDLPPVTEIQEYVRINATYTILSNVSVEVSRHVTVLTKGETTLSSLKGGCAIAARLTLEFRTRFGQEWLETYAESESVDAFEQWLNLARSFCEKKIGRVQPSSSEAGQHSDVNMVDGNAVPSDVKVLESDEVPSTSQNFVEVRKSRSSAMHRRLWFLWAIWRSLCETVKNSFINTETNRALFRQSNFFLKAGISFGLGIAAGLTSGYFCSKHSKLKKIVIRGAGDEDSLI